MGEERTRGDPRLATYVQVSSAPGATGTPKRTPYTQAEAAVSEALPEAAEAEAEVTLRELEEALEKEVLTRQSLSRELETIRTANQNFARLELGLWCKSLPWAASPAGIRRAHSPYLPAVNSARPRPGIETWRRTSDSSRSGCSCCRLKGPQASPSSALTPRALKVAGGEVGRGLCGHLVGRARGPGWGTPRHHPPPSLHAPYASLFSFQLSRGSPVPGLRIHLPM